MESMENQETVHKDLQILLEIKENQFCFDCNAESPDWACINHGIFLCLKCSGQHSTKIPEYSNIKSINFDAWEELNCIYMKTGGNKKFKNFLNGFNIDFNLNDPLRKYKTKAADYYRSLLKNLVEGGSLNDPPEVNEGASLIGELKKESSSWGFGFGGFSVFGGVKDILNKGVTMVNEKLVETNLKENLTSFYEKSKEKSAEVISKSAAIGSEVIHKSKEMGADVLNKSKEIGSDVLNKSKEISNELIHKSKDIGQDVIQMSLEYGTIITEKSKEIGSQVIEKTKEGYGIVSKNITDAYENYQGNQLNPEQPGEELKDLKKNEFEEKKEEKKE